MGPALHWCNAQLPTRVLPVPQLWLVNEEYRRARSNSLLAPSCCRCLCRSRHRPPGGGSGSLLRPQMGCVTSAASIQGAAAPIQRRRPRRTSPIPTTRAPRRLHPPRRLHTIPGCDPSAMGSCLAARPPCCAGSSLMCGVPAPPGLFELPEAGNSFSGQQSWLTTALRASRTSLRTSSSRCTPLGGAARRLHAAAACGCSLEARRRLLAAQPL